MQAVASSFQDRSVHGEVPSRASSRSGGLPAIFSSMHQFRSRLPCRVWFEPRTLHRSKASRVLQQYSGAKINPANMLGGLRVAVVFACAAIVGPLLALLDIMLPRFALRPPGHDDLFLYELSFLLWPTQVLAVMETSLGSTAAVALAVAANIASFEGLGLLVKVLARRTAASLAVLFGVSCMLVGCELWSAGYDPKFINWSASTTALVFYSGLLVGARRVLLGSAGISRRS